MNVEELMIGDIVRVNRNGYFKNDTIVKVYGIDATNRLEVKGLQGSAICIPVDDIDFYSNGIWVEYLSPIPLTQEILEKNGFSKLEHGWILKRIGMEICIEFIAEKWSLVIHNEFAPKDEHGRADLVTFCHDWFKGFYVHELQHALRLCGIDKEIVVC